MNRGSRGRLTVDSVSNIGPHYARTLREWKRKFLRNWDTIIAVKLEADYKLDPSELDIFKRKWICTSLIAESLIRLSHSSKIICKYNLRKRDCTKPFAVTIVKLGS
jgi:hypothetical protein